MKRLIGVAAIMIAAGSASGASAADHPRGAAFVHNAIEGDNSEITLGRIAAERGASPGVRAYGRTLVADHSKSKMQAVALARRMHTYAPKSMIGMAIVERTKLQHLSGPAFDREFTRYMTKDHKEDIADFEAEARSGDNPVLTAFARKTLPTLQKHLAIAERLNAKVA